MTLQQRLGVRVFNRLGTGWRRFSQTSSPFQPDRLEQQAALQQDFADFGHPQYREPLELLCESYAADRALTFTGQLVCSGTLSHHLRNRLRIQQTLRESPELRSQAVTRPLFVIGLPRTGTTLLYNLLAQDRTSRPLLFWESMQPAPSPRPESRTADPRIAKARRTLRGLHLGLPELANIHQFQADAPEECLGLLMNSFMTPFFRGRLPQYRHWLEQVSDEFVNQVYQEYRDQLQILQRYVSGSRWLLKCPSHLWGLKGLLQAFPDACIVQTHRHLSESLPSLCSLTATVDQLCYETVDQQEVGQRGLRTVQQLIRRGLAARDAGSQASILDVSYPALVRDPVGAVLKIYEHFQLPVGQTFEADLQKFQQEHPHKGTAHQYALEQFGLTPDLIQDQFHEYHDRFDLRAGESTATFR